MPNHMNCSLIENGLYSLQAYSLKTLKTPNQQVIKSQHHFMYDKRFFTVLCSAVQHTNWIGVNYFMECIWFKFQITIDQFKLISIRLLSTMHENEHEHEYEHERTISTSQWHDILLVDISNKHTHLFMSPISFFFLVENPNKLIDNRLMLRRRLCCFEYW